MPDEMNPDWIDYTSDEDILIDVLDSFKEGGERELDENDQLFFCFINHGATNSQGDTFFGFPLIDLNDYIIYLLNLLGLNVNTPRLFDYELANYMDGIDGKLILALHPCHSGGFIDNVGGENRVVISSCAPYELDDGWIYIFRQVLNFQYPDADFNGDDKISLMEAYQFSATEIFAQTEQHSLIDDNGDGIGHFFTDPEYDPNTEGMDGYLASTTFL